PQAGGAHATSTSTSTDRSPTRASGAVAGDVAGGSGEAPAGATGADDAGERLDVLSGYLTDETVREELAATGKDEAIRELAWLLSASGKVADSAELVRAALAREEQGTTGLGDGIAIPHAKTGAVTAPVVAFARSREGVEWGAPDGTRARLLFMIAVPESAAGDEHLRILALLSRKLMDPDFRERLLSAPGRDGIRAALGEIR
ncbi:PTS sugar transporter subunit IIA, partial [Streptomyces sparsus]